jgi:uncharacterized protein YggE
MRQLWPLLSFAVLAFMVAPAVAAPHHSAPVISVSGTGEAQSAPDTAAISAGVTTSGATAGEALAANTKAMAALIATLKAQGVDAKDIQTSRFSVNPQYVYPDRNGSGDNSPPRIVGYQVENGVDVKVRKLADLGTILDKIVGAGANTINTISFSVANPAELLTEARKAAFADARQKAETYAEAAGGALGSIVSVDETQAPPPMPRPMMAKAAFAAEAAPVPVEAGQLTFTVDVAVRWAFKAGGEE